MPFSDTRPVTARSSRLGRRPALTLAVVALPLVLAACSSGSSSSSSAASTPASSTSSSSSSPTPSDTSSASDSSSPTASVTDSPSATTSASSTSTATSSATPSGTPSTVSPSPSGSVAGITVGYSPVVASPSQQVSIVASTNRSLAGRTAYIVKWNDGAPRVLGTGAVLSRTGTAKTYAQLQRTGVLQLVVPSSALASGPFDPTTPLLAQSSRFTVTIR